MSPTTAEQLGIKPFEAADYLQSDEDCAQYLQACIDEAPEDAALFAKSVGDIARARHDATGPRYRHHTGRALQGAGRTRQPQFCHRRQSFAYVGLAVQHGREVDAKLSTKLLGLAQFFQKAVHTNQKRG